MRKALVASGRFAGMEKALTLNVVRRFCYKVPEYESKVWDEEIKIMCAEPFCYYINTLRYIKDQKFKRNECDAIGIQDGVAKVFDKFGWRMLWADHSYDSSDDWIVDYIGLDAEVEKQDEGWEWAVIENWVSAWRTKKAKKAIKTTDREKMLQIAKDHNTGVVDYEEPNMKKRVIEDPEVPQEVYDHYEYLADIKAGK